MSPPRPVPSPSPSRRPSGGFRRYLWAWLAVLGVVVAAVGAAVAVYQVVDRMGPQVAGTDGGAVPVAPLRQAPAGEGTEDEGSAPPAEAPSTEAPAAEAPPVEVEAPPVEAARAAEPERQRDYLMEVHAALGRSNQARPLTAEEITRIKGSTVRVVGSRTTGSGFIVEHRGRLYVVTNHHVVFDPLGREDPNLRLEVESRSQWREVKGVRVVAVSRDTDLALLTSQQLPARSERLPLAPTDTVFETQPVVIAGYPFGDQLAALRTKPAATISNGTVSSLRRNEAGKLVRVQLDADLNPGNSGGPVLDYGGSVVGVAVEEVASTTISFMIPVSGLHRLLADLDAGRVARRPGTGDRRAGPGVPGRRPGRIQPPGAPATPPSWMTPAARDWRRPDMDRSLAVGTRLQEVGRLPLRSLIRGLGTVDGGRHAVFLNASDGEVVKVRLPNLEVVRRVAVPGAVDLDVAPGGESLYVLSRVTVEGQPGSVLYQLDLDLDWIRRASIPEVGLEVTGDDHGLAFVSLNQGYEGLAAVSLEEGRVVARSRVYGRSALAMHPAQDRLYVGSRGYSPGDFYAVLKELNDGGQLESYDSPYHGDYDLGGDLSLTPDGRYLFGEWGGVLRVGGARSVDLRFVAEVPRHVDAAFSPDHRVFFLSHLDGTVTAWSLDDLQDPLATYGPGGVLAQMVLDGKNRVLVGFVHPTEADTSHPRHRHEPSAGDLVAYSFAR